MRWLLKPCFSHHFHGIDRTSLPIGRSPLRQDSVILRLATTITAKMFGIGLPRVATCAAALAVMVHPAAADRIENQVAIFSALDKVTARISKFEVALGETATFGALKVTPRVCYSRPSTEQPKTTTFVEVDEIQLDGQPKRIFTGWMFAESPGLYGVEHPTYDVWLTECAKPQKATAQRAPTSPNATAPSAAGETGTADSELIPQEPRRRVRR